MKNSIADSDITELRSFFNGIFADKRLIHLVPNFKIPDYVFNHELDRAKACFEHYRYYTKLRVEFDILFFGFLLLILIMGTMFGTHSTWIANSLSIIGIVAALLYLFTSTWFNDQCDEAIYQLNRIKNSLSVLPEVQSRLASLDEYLGYKAEICSKNDISIIVTSEMESILVSIRILHRRHGETAAKETDDYSELMASATKLLVIVNKLGFVYEWESPCVLLQPENSV